MKTAKPLFRLCLCALLAALYVGLDYAATTVSSLFGGAVKISLNGLPVMIAAVWFGPLWGMAVGFVGALLGQLLTYGLTATTLLWVAPAVLRGAVMGLLFLAFGKKTKPLPLITAGVFSSLVVTAANTGVQVLDSKIYHYASKAYLWSAVWPRAVLGMVTGIVMALLLIPILHGLSHLTKEK